MSLDPRTRLLLLFAVGGYAVILEHAGSLAILAGASLLALLVAPVTPTWRWRALGFAAAVVVSTAWTQGLFYAGAPRTALLRLGPIAVWREGVVHGLVQSLRLVAMGLAGTTLALSTPPDRLLAGLVGLRVPHGVAFLAVAALRFVPVVGAEWLAVRQARARRGRPLWPRPPWDWLSEEMGMLAPVAARAVRRARTLAESLEARGFDPVIPRRPRVASRLGPADLGLLCLAYAGLAAIGAGAVLYRLYLWGIWYSPALRPLYGWVRAWV